MDFRNFYFEPTLSFQPATMNTTTPLATTIALRDTIIQGFENYQGSKSYQGPQVLIAMLATVAGFCVRLLKLFKDTSALT